MKLLLLLLCLPCIICVGDLAEEAINKCRAELQLSQEEFDEVHALDVLNGDVPKRKYLCYMSCLYQELHLMNPDGTFNFENDIIKLDETHPNYQCFKTNRKDACEAAYEFTKCFNAV